MRNTTYFEFYKGHESDQFSFYRIPKQLVKDKRFSALSDAAKILYGLLLDRMGLSARNGWIDENDHVFIIYTIEQIREDLGWDRKEMVELWRASCCEAINRRAQEYGYDIHLDHRSFKRQGIDITPEIHEGYMARRMEQDGLVADRCQINRDIRKYNSVLDRIRQVAKDITSTIVEKARDILERFKNLAGGFGPDRESGRNDEAFGEATDRNRGTITVSQTSRGRELQIEGRSGRTADLKRDIERTEQAIDRTERRIGELKGLIRRKKEERNERMERLKSRRAAVAHGRDPGRKRESTEREEQNSRGELNNAAADIRAFLGSLDAEDRDERYAAEASIREAETDILHSQAERGNVQAAERQSIAAAEQRQAEERRWSQRSRDRGWDLEL